MRNLTLLCVGLLASSELFADTPRQQLDPLVVTSTREATPLSNLASNTGIVSEEEIDLIRPNHISELVDRIPGVYVHRNNGQENLVSIRSPILTGAGAAGSFLFMEDGVPLRAAGFSNINGLSEANAEQAGRVEVIRGPGSAFYGSNAMFGLVNVLSRAPSDELERTIDFSVGPHDLAGFKTTFSDSSENQGYRLNFNAHHDGGYRDDSGYDQQKLTLRHDYRFSNTEVKTVLSAFNLNQETAGFIQSRTDDEAYKDSSLAKTNPNPEAYRDWKSFRLSSSWATKLSNGNQLTITPYLRDNEMRFLRHFVPEQSIEENSHSSIGAQTAYAMDLDGGHKLVAGADVEFTRGSLEDTQMLPDINKFGKYRPQGKHYDYEVDAYTIAPYLHSEWLLTERTRLIAGLRFEHTQYEYDNKMVDGNSKEDGTPCPVPSGCLYLRPSDRTDTFNNLSPKLGIVQKLNDSNSLYANLSQGFRAPQTSELYQLQNKQVEGDIDSEQLDSVEIGAKGYLSGIQYDIALYHMKRKNVFFRDGRGLNVTDGKTKHDGIEIGLGASLIQNVDLGISYSYARHKYDFDRPANGIQKGNDVDTAPRHQSNVRLGWDYLPNSRAELEWIYISQYYTDSSNRHSYDGHDLFNLRIEQTVNRQLNLYGRITNLTDTAYAERADFAFGSHRFFPGEPRSLHVGASYSF